MISFVVPAYNEEAVIANTLNAIHCSARAVNEPYEIVVADDASTDRTAEIALSLGACVERVKYRQIAGTRNGGARASVGEFIFFVDADTLINPRTLRSALTSMKKGAAGGGATTWFKRTEALPAYIWLGFVGSGAVAKRHRRSMVSSAAVRSATIGKLECLCLASKATLIGKISREPARA
jgi:glycosyltransferase involved in cell wall biosynthesis